MSDTYAFFQGKLIVGVQNAWYPFPDQGIGLGIDPDFSGIGYLLDADNDSHEGNHQITISDRPGIPSPTAPEPR